VNLAGLGGARMREVDSVPISYANHNEKESPWLRHLVCRNGDVACRIDRQREHAGLSDGGVDRGGKRVGCGAAHLSKSDATQYVKAIAKRVIDPATDHEREEASMNSGDDAIVISPAKFALPAGGTCSCG